MYSIFFGWIFIGLVVSKPVAILEKKIVTHHFLRTLRHARRLAQGKLILNKVSPNKHLESNSDFAGSFI